MYNHENFQWEQFLSSVIYLFVYYPSRNIDSGFLAASLPVETHYIGLFFRKGMSSYELEERKEGGT